MKARNSTTFICVATVAGSLAHAQNLHGPAVRIDTHTTHPMREVFAVKVDGVWQPVPSAASLVHTCTASVPLGAFLRGFLPKRRESRPVWPCNGFQAARRATPHYLRRWPAVIGSAFSVQLRYI